MIEILQPGFRTGAVHIPASKSQAHRLLICAALSQNETVIRCRGISRDIAATADCLNALGAEIWLRGEDLTVRPITQKPQGTRHLHCQESGSTLRFLLPLTGVTFPFVSNGGSAMLASWGLLAFLKASDTREKSSFAIRSPAGKEVPVP